MEKVVFNQLTIEVTRRCNMECAHCLRGDAQNEDIFLSAIDGVLDQTEAIGRLIITGGEPMLNLRAIQYIANGIAMRGIPLMRLQIVTNGLIYDERFIAIIKMFSAIIHITQRHGYDRNIPEPWRVQLGISLDRYHSMPAVCKANYIKYKNALRRSAEVLRVSHGNAPKNEGRAIALAKTIDHTFTMETYTLQKIEVLSIDHKPVCRYYDSYHLQRANQKVICCGMYLNVFGEMLPGLACDTDYRHRGLYVCSAWEPIWENVLAYNNQCGRMNCAICDHLRTNGNLMRSKKEAELSYQLATAPEAQDEPSAEPVYIGEIKKHKEAFAKWSQPYRYGELENAATEKEYLRANTGKYNDEKSK